MNIDEKTKISLFTATSIVIALVTGAFYVSGLKAASDAKIEQVTSFGLRQQEAQITRDARQLEIDQRQNEMLLEMREKYGRLDEKINSIKKEN